MFSGIKLKIKGITNYMRANRDPIHNLRQKKWGCLIVSESNGEFALDYNVLTGHLQRLSYQNWRRV